MTGIEADIQYTDFTDNVSAVTIGRAFPGARNNIFEQKLEYLGTVRARLGYAWDRTLVYGTGGFAYGGARPRRLELQDVSLAFSSSGAPS